MHAVGLMVAITTVDMALLAAGMARDRASANAETSVARPDPAPILRGGGLELVDERGRMRARLTLEPGGEVVFRLFDDTGTIRVKLGAGRDGSGLLLANDVTEPGIHLIADTAGSRVRLVNRDGRQRVLTP